jgi:transcription elongation factor Elf1
MAGSFRKRWRRKYYIGTCQDCGHTRSVTTVFFWVNKMRYVVCADCIKAYRTVILTNHAPEI